MADQANASLSNASGSFFSELLQSCSLDTVHVQKGDTIVLSSDGLWDVITADQLQRIFQRHSQAVSLTDDCRFDLVSASVASTRARR